MGTYVSGGTSRATPATRDAMRRSALARQCPACGRRSAMSSFDEGIVFGSACRWCGYAVAFNRDESGRPDRG